MYQRAGRRIDVSQQLRQRETLGVVVNLQGAYSRCQFAHARQAVFLQPQHQCMHLEAPLDIQFLGAELDQQEVIPGEPANDIVTVDSGVLHYRLDQGFLNSRRGVVRAQGLDTGQLLRFQCDRLGITHRFETDAGPGA